MFSQFHCSHIHHVPERQAELNLLAMQQCQKKAVIYRTLLDGINTDWKRRDSCSRHRINQTEIINMYTNQHNVTHTKTTIYLYEQFNPTLLSLLDIPLTYHDRPQQHLSISEPFWKLNRNYRDCFLCLISKSIVQLISISFTFQSQSTYESNSNTSIWKLSAPAALSGIQ